LIELDERTAAVLERKGYHIGKKLNEGAFGCVYLAERIPIGTPAAVKVMQMDKIGRNYVHRMLPREIAALITIIHPYVVLIHDIIHSSGRVFVFMEYADGGDLLSHIRQCGALTESMAAYWFEQMSSALQYVHHSLFLAHRDIKLDNMLLCGGVCKLTDFGFAAECWDHATNRPLLTNTRCGTPVYFSPQLLRHRPYNPYSSDCWAMGVALFTMLNNKYPFHGRDLKLMYSEICDVTFLPKRYVRSFSTEVCQLMESLMQENEYKRYTMNDVMNCGWIKRRGKLQQEPLCEWYTNQRVQ